MENEINVSMFIQQLTEYLKIGIYVNKGTELDTILNKCIKLYNKYKTIEMTSKPSEADEVFIRKCLKRLNLIFKLDATGLPVNISDKNNQLKIMVFAAHKSIDLDDLDDLINHATQYNIDILTGVPMTFILKKSKYQGLLWQYTRSLYYMSQVLLAKLHNNEVIYNAELDKLEGALGQIADIENVIKANEVISVDKFLNSKLVAAGITNQNIGEATGKVKDILEQRGLGGNNIISRMVDSISDKLTTSDLSDGNILQNITEISRHVASEILPELQRDPDSFRNSLGSITDIFKETMDDDDNNMPGELKGLFQSLLSSASSLSTGNTAITPELSQTLKGFLPEDQVNSLLAGQLDKSQLDACFASLK